MATMGYAFIGVGTAVILVTLLMGYGIYASANGDLNGISVVGTNSGSGSINGSISTLTGNLQGTATLGTYTAIEVIVLFLFASIGYKIAYLGVQMNGQASRQGKQAQVKG